MTAAEHRERRTGHSTHAGGSTRKKRRTVVDKLAAAVMLQTWLDGQDHVKSVST